MQISVNILLVSDRFEKKLVSTHPYLLQCILQEYWILNSPMQTTIILLVEQIVTALGGEFKVFSLKYMSILTQSWY